MAKKYFLDVPANIKKLTRTHTVYVAFNDAGTILEHGFDRRFAKTRGAAKGAKYVVKLPSTLWKK